jgi:tetratricopeptide (TPR) repeat protein
VEDTVRSVRIAAAQQILDIPTDSLGPEDRATVENAIGEYAATLGAQADFPEVQLNLSRYAERLGRRGAARQALRAAVTLDPKLTEAWLRLAQQQVEAGRFPEARATLEEALAEVAEGHGTLQQLLGRVLVQLNDEPAARIAFEKAFQALPEELEVRVEYASLLTTLGEHRKALALLERANEAAQAAAPFNPQVLYLRAYNHLQLGERAKAREVAQELADHHPESPLIKHLQEQF